MIRNQEKEVEDRKRKEQMDRKIKARADLQQKIIEENERRLAIEVIFILISLDASSQTRAR